MVIRDALFVLTSKDILSYADAKIEDGRDEHLHSRLITVAHHYKYSQEILYTTFDVLNR